jgi:hypothetical protein
VRAFYKTIVRAEILSEEPIPAGMTLGDIYEATDTGAYVGSWRNRLQIKLTGKEMANALLRAGSEPGFFRLDSDGVHEDDVSVLFCSICGEGMPMEADLREHLAGHNPNARTMDASKVGLSFSEEPIW